MKKSRFSENQILSILVSTASFGSKCELVVFTGRMNTRSGLDEDSCTGVRSCRVTIGT